VVSRSKSEETPPKKQRVNFKSDVHGESGTQLCGLRTRHSGSAAGSNFTRLIFVVHFHYNLSVRLHACSPPRLTATQLARSSVLNRLIAPAGLSPALMCASRAHMAITE